MQKQTRALQSPRFSCYKHLCLPDVHSASCTRAPRPDSACRGCAPRLKWGTFSFFATLKKRSPPCRFPAGPPPPPCRVLAAVGSLAHSLDTAIAPTGKKKSNPDGLLFFLPCVLCYARPKPPGRLLDPACGGFSLRSVWRYGCAPWALASDTGGTGRSGGSPLGPPTESTSKIAEAIARMRPEGRGYYQICDFVPPAPRHRSTGTGGKHQVKLG